MRVLLLAAFLAVPLGASAHAARAPWRGTVASDLGGVLRLQGRLREIAPGHWVGALKCRPVQPAVGRCLSKRLTATMQVSAGLFSAAIAGRGVQCLAEGIATASNLSGRYACGAGTVIVDAGFFTLTRRR